MTRALVIAALLTACGAGDDAASGKPDLDGDEKLNVMTSPEIAQLCTYTTAVEMGPRTVACDGGGSITLTGEADCETSLSDLTGDCGADVDDFEACAESLDADPCAGGGNPCEPLLDCFQNESP